MAKKVLAFCLCLVLIFCFAGCSLIGSSNHKMTAEITEVSGRNITVASADGKQESEMLDLYYVTLDQDSELIGNLNVGDKVEITYKGDIMETYPKQFQKIIKIEVLEKSQ